MLLFGLLGMQEPPKLPPIPREFRAAWVASVNNIDWPSRKGLSGEAVRQEFARIADRAKALNLNALVVQVRPSADSFYFSSLEPSSEFLTGRQGAPLEQDPLAAAISECRARGLEIHAWFNPYRARHFSATGPLHASHIAKTDPAAVVTWGQYLWMDPGNPRVRERTLAVMMDVARRYDLDGVHIDDYFYPYPIAGKDFPDDASYAAYRAKGGKLARADWRRSNVDGFVETFYRQLKRERPHMKFGISPFGIYRPGVPAGIEAGMDQYSQLYADARKWFREGWCDYMAPQLYWPIAQTKQSYPKLLDWWIGENRKGRHLWIGNYTSRTNPSEGNWPASEVVRQIQLTRERGAGGNIHFSVKALMLDWNRVGTALGAGVYRDPAAIPASPWLGRERPSAPAEGVRVGEEVRWQPVAGTHVYAVATCGPEGWSRWALAGRPAVALRPGDRWAVAVALGRTGAESPGAIVALDRDGG